MVEKIFFSIVFDGAAIVTCPKYLHALHFFVTDNSVYRSEKGVCLTHAVIIPLGNGSKAGKSAPRSSLHLARVPRVIRIHPVVDST